MRLLSWLFARVMTPALKRFAVDLANPFDAQSRQLRDVLSANAASEFGRAHDFAKLRDFTTFRQTVPIRTYDEFLPWIERMKRGESDVLVSQPVEMFATTSGTSAAPKFCPVTRRFTLEHHQAHKLWMVHLGRDHPDLLSGRFLSVVSPATTGHTAGGISYGSASGRQYQNQALPIRRRHAVPYEVCGIDAYEARYHALLVFALGADVSIATSVNPSTLVLLAQRLRNGAEPLLADLEAGELAHAPGLSTPQRQALERRLRPQPERARDLRERCRTDGALLPRNAWPNLAVLVTWQGGSAPFYLAQLDDLWGAVPRRCLGLRASEGTFSIPLQDHSPSGVLAVGSHVLEFMPASMEPRPTAPTLLAHELEKGQRYRLIITTSGGLYRYDLADIVEVTGFRERTPEIAFLHKAGKVLSITGEKITEDQVVGVMRQVEETLQGLQGFTVTLELQLPPRYVLAVEWTSEDAQQPQARQALLEDFEHRLQAANEEYREKRASGRLAPPRLLVLAPGSYQKHRAALATQGRPDGQIKPPHLIPPPGPGPAPVAGCPFFDCVDIVDVAQMGRSS